MPEVEEALTVPAQDFRVGRAAVEMVVLVLQIQTQAVLLELLTQAAVGVVVGNTTMGLAAQVVLAL